MDTQSSNIRTRGLSAFFLAGSVSMFLAAAICDLAYSKTFQVQWINFAAWLLFGATLYAGITLLISLIDLVVGKVRDRSLIPHLIMVIALLLLGIYNSFVHARDAYGSMPLGMWVSWVLAVIAIVASWHSLSAIRRSWRS